MVKTFTKLLPEGVYYLKLGMQHLRLKLYKAGIDDDLRLTFTYFTAWSKLITCEFEWEICYKVIKWEKLQMTKLTEDLYFREKHFPTGVCLPLPRGYIHVYDHYFKQLFSKPLGQSRPIFMWSFLGKKERKFCVKWSCLHDQDGCHAHIWQNRLQNPKSYDLEIWHAA